MNVWFCHFFTILATLGKKCFVPGKILLREKIFDFHLFVLKYISKHSESIPTKKILTKNFWFGYFSLLSHYQQKWLTPRKIFWNGKKFSFRDFRFFLGKIGLCDTFLAPQVPKIFRNFAILVKKCPILWKLKILLHHHTWNDKKVGKHFSI